MVDQRTAVNWRPLTAPTSATVAMALVFGASCAWLAVRSPEGVPGSADPGAVGVPIWLGLIPVLLGLALIRVTPPRLPDHPVRAPDNAHLRRELALLLGCAGAFPLFIGLWGLTGEGYVLIKVILLLSIPGTVLPLWRRCEGAPTVTVQRPVRVGAWPLIPVGAYILLSQVGPLAPAASPSWPDPVTLIIAASVTALTAGVGEEIFYRYWLQTRLEAIGGRWFGILAASLVFAAMHLGSHGRELAWDLRIVAVIAQQGTFGIISGYLWSRYRRLWAPILCHILANGLLVAVHLLGG